MRRWGWLVTSCLLLFAGSVACAVPLAVDTAGVHRILGSAGSYNAAEGVYKVSFPRTDVKVRVDGWELPPFMGLASWVAFENGMRGEALLMGDLVLFQDEVNPTMSEALKEGLKVTALHNHFFYDEPKVFFMHIEGEGPGDSLARAVRRTMDRTGDVRKAAARPEMSFGSAALPAASSIDGAGIEKILGQKGTAQNGMYKVVIGRKVAMMGVEAGKDMGVNTWAGFAGSNDNAMVDGDFCVRENELQAVLKTLRGAGINIVAIHQHMTDEQPRYIFLHYWGRGKAADLAAGVKAALDKTSDVGP